MLRIETIICVSAFPAAADGKFFLSPGWQKLSCTRIQRKILSWQRLSLRKRDYPPNSSAVVSWTIQKTISMGQSHKKKCMFLPIKWFLLFVASGQKIRSVRTTLFKWGKKMLWITAWLHFWRENTLMGQNYLQLLDLKSFQIFGEEKQRK